MADPFARIPEEYRSQVMRARMEAQGEHTYLLTVPLHRPLTSFVSTDIVPPPLRGLPTITLRRCNEHPPFSWVPDGEIQNL